MNTIFMLMAQYSGKTMIPLNIVCEDFFPHLSEDKLRRKIHAGTVQLPLIRIESSQKASTGVDLRDLANYLDLRREEGHACYNRLHN